MKTKYTIGEEIKIGNVSMKITTIANFGGFAHYGVSTFHDTNRPYGEGFNGYLPAAMVDELQFGAVKFAVYGIE